MTRDQEELYRPASTIYIYYVSGRKVRWKNKERRQEIPQFLWHLLICVCDDHSNVPFISQIPIKGIPLPPPGHCAYSKRAHSSGFRICY